MNKTVFGINFTDVNINYVLEKILTEPNQDKNKVVVTPNMDFVMRYNEKQNMIFNHVLDNSYLSLCDSKIIYFLSKISSGNRVENVVTGSNLTYKLFESLGDKKVAIVGPPEEEIQLLKQKYLLNIVFSECPYFGFEDNAEYIAELSREIINSQPDILFLALGSPKQEIVASELANHDFPFWCLCIGASIDFLTGKQIRSPKLFSRFGLEWLHRLACNPKRLYKRYSKNILFLLKYLIKNGFKV